MININKLKDDIKVVCPINEIVINKATDRLTWIIDFPEATTDTQKAAARAILYNWVDTPNTINMSKLEFKKRLTILDKYTEAKAILDSLPEDKVEDWELALCVASDNEDILSVLQALNVNVNEIFY